VRFSNLLKRISTHPLERGFFLRPVQSVARDLLGMHLIRILNGERVGGVIVETEAYDGEKDQACHARSGMTERNKVMYQQGGCAYIYFTYGMHWLLNCVTGETGYPAAVLLRAILPNEGIERIRKNRNSVPMDHWCDGPAKLTRALEIDGKLNGTDLCSEKSELMIENGTLVPDEKVAASPRIGIHYASEPWLSQPWRFTALEVDV
jgi:DNA-3-methyladenine glycosylase